MAPAMKNAGIKQVKTCADRYSSNVVNPAWRAAMKVYVSTILAPIWKRFFQDLSRLGKLGYLHQSHAVYHSDQIKYLRIFYSVNGPLAFHFSFQDISFMENVQMLGNGGLRSLESGQNLTNASFTFRKIFQQLKPGGIG
jgi:hypothetical protein